MKELVVLDFTLKYGDSYLGRDEGGNTTTEDEAHGGHWF